MSKKSDSQESKANSQNIYNINKKTQIFLAIQMSQLIGH